MTIEREGGKCEKIFSPDQISNSVDLALKGNLINMFVLKGPITEGNNVHLSVSLKGIAGIEKSELITFVDEENEFTKKDIDWQLANLKIPQTLSDGRCSLRDKNAFKRASEILIGKDTPLVLLEMGESDQTEQEMIVLYMVNGITIETALTMLRIANQGLEKGEQRG